MKNRFPLILIAFFCLCLSELAAQVYEGQVLDRKTKEPVAFANVVYSSGAGTVTDIDGRFRIETNAKVDQLTVSSLGYSPTVIDITLFLKTKEVWLEPQQYQLKAIDVVPGENPALVVMRQVVQNANQHNPSEYDPFSCIMYHKMVVDFDWPEGLPQEDIRMIKDSMGVKNESYVFLFESVSEKRHWKKGIGKEKIISGRVSGLKTPVIASFPAILQPFSFYDQFISLLSIDYLNPASKAGLSAYRFVLEDTYVNPAGDSIYYISYVPRKGKNFRGMRGAFHIDGQSKAIRTVSASTVGTTNGLRLFIRQNYQQSPEGRWFPKQLESSLEFVSIGASRRLPFPLVGKGKSYVTAINTKPEFSARDFDNVTMEDVAIDKDAPDVSMYRYRPLTRRDSLTYHYLDSIGRRRQLDAIINMQMSLIKGYLPLGSLQLDLNKLIDYNNYEGLKLGLGLSTSDKVSDNFSIGGYYTHGFGDKDNKYGSFLALTPFRNKEQKLSISYKDDVNTTGAVSFVDGLNMRTSEAFGRFLTETMDLSKQWNIDLNLRFLKFFKSNFYYRFGDIRPTQEYRFSNSSVIEPRFDFYEYGLKLKWANKETFVKSPLGKISNGTAWPGLWLNIAAGQWETDRTFDYQRLDARLDKTFKYPNSMYTALRLQGGKLFGDYPSTFLYSALGSYKSFGLHVPNSFGTMRMNEFAAERFTALYFSHGIPLSLNTNNRIKPEIVLMTNVAFGEAPEGMNDFNKGYYESGLYLKNLFSNFIFQYGLSVHYRYGAYSLPDEKDNWAFKLGLEFAF